MRLPPKDVTPSKLFRLLLQTPRPLVSLPYRLEAAPNVLLFARALHALEWAEIGEADTRDKRSLLISQSLCDAQGRTLIPTTDTGLLSAAEFDRLLGHVFSGLSSIGPCEAKSDRNAWIAKLKIGARENPSVARALGSCFEGYKLAPYECPERYFGIARKDLLDGHWMAYHACLSLVLDELKRKRK